MARKSKKLAVAGEVAQYGFTAGAPVPSDCAQLVGSTLARMAEEQRVDGIRSLNKAEAFDTIYHDPHHPLRFLFGDFKDVDGAARKHWIEYLGKIIRSVTVRYVTVGNVKPRAVMTPMFVRTEVPARHAGKTRIEPRHAVRTDLLTNSAPFANAVALHVKRIRDATGSLRTLLIGRNPPREITELCDGLDAVLSAYDASLTSREEAAE